MKIQWAPNIHLTTAPSFFLLYRHQKHRRREQGSHHSRLQLLPHITASDTSNGSFCRTRFYPLPSQCLGHRQARAVLRPWKEVRRAGAGRAQSCGPAAAQKISHVVFSRLTHRGGGKGQKNSHFGDRFGPASLHISQIRYPPAPSSGRGHRLSVNNPEL